MWPFHQEDPKKRNTKNCSKTGDIWLSIEDIDEFELFEEQGLSFMDDEAIDGKTFVFRTTRTRYSWFIIR